ncbi:MAG: hypothetical protein JOZ69_14275 [Myxococcales bacterium]|nr:hypothetical protein [Myxococcales bacterium]
MRRSMAGAAVCSALALLPGGAGAQRPAGATGAAGATDGARPPDVRWSLHVLYRPGAQEARVYVSADGGVVPVRGPWECNYRRTTVEKEDLVKVKCAHTSGAVVGTLAMCRREPGQSDIAQLNIGVDGVAAYETIDLSCLVTGPGDRGRPQARDDAPR